MGLCPFGRPSDWRIYTGQHQVTAKGKDGRAGLPTGLPASIHCGLSSEGVGS